VPNNAVPVLVIFAPTACGKTDLLRALFSMSVSSPFAGLAEVISADSMQVYRGMDIGTAKPDAALRSELPHHLIDIREPTEQFGAGDFVPLADLSAREIYSRGKLPVIAGGTGFYIRHFLCGLPITPGTSAQTRETLQSRLHSHGADTLYSELESLDPVSAAKIHVHDEYRILRALEVCIDGGKPLSSYMLDGKTRPEYDFCIVILNRNRDDLYRRINSRVEKMFADGLTDEVRILMERGLTAATPGMKAIGYREFFYPEIQKIADAHLRNAECMKLIQRDTRRYAKRQLTFIRGFAEQQSALPAVASFSAEDTAGIAKFVGEWMKNKKIPKS
jgi:tRNA dimethylallyltransferase